MSVRSAIEPTTRPHSDVDRDFHLAMSCLIRAVEALQADVDDLRQRNESFQQIRLEPREGAKPAQ